MSFCLLIHKYFVCQVFGVVIIIISQTTRASLESAIDEHDINIDTASLITTIDVSLHGRWLLLTSYWIWGIIILIYSCYGAVAVILESPAHIKVVRLSLICVFALVSSLSGLNKRIFSYILSICYWVKSDDFIGNSTIVECTANTQCGCKYWFKLCEGVIRRNLL